MLLHTCCLLITKGCATTKKRSIVPRWSPKVTPTSNELTTLRTAANTAANQAASPAPLWQMGKPHRNLLVSGLVLPPLWCLGRTKLS